MALSRQEKVKRMLRNFVGTTASVAVVAAAATFTINVNAEFLSLTVFRDKAYYQVEVVQDITVEGSLSSGETLPEPEPISVRLRVQNQWDDFYVPLTAGVNEGFIEPLRENQTYTLTVELQNALNWSSIATETFRTRPKTLAVISSLKETTTPTNPFMNVQAQIYTQNEIIEDGNWQARLVATNFEYTLPLQLGDNSVLFENIPHRNETYRLEVEVTNSQGITIIDQKNFQPLIFIDADWTLSFPTLSTLNIQPRLDYDALPNTQYWIRLKTNNVIVKEQALTPSGIDFSNLLAQETYQVEWLIRYGNDINRLQEVLIETREVTPVRQPLFVLSIQDLHPGHRFSLTIDRDLVYAAIYLQIQEGITLTLVSFVEKSSSDVAQLYEAVLTTNLMLGTTIQLILVQPAPQAYPITFHSFIYGG